MSADRCTAWVKTRKEDWERAAKLIEDDDGSTSDDLSDERDGYVEYQFDDVRYVDEMLGCLEKAGIPYVSVSSAGEYPEGICVCLPGHGGTFCRPMLEGEIIVEFNRESGEIDQRTLEGAQELVKAEKRFLNYCKTGVLT